MSGHHRLKIKKMEKEKNDEMMRIFSLESEGYICAGDAEYVFPSRFGAGLEPIHNMPVRPDDVFVVTFPRSGTTWSQEMVWLVANNFDFDKAKTSPLTERYSFLEFPFFQRHDNLKKLQEEAKTDESKRMLLKEIEMGTTEYLAKAPSPRFIKTHLPLSILPPELLDTAKVVYVARDPRDVCVSFFHLSRMVAKMSGFCGTFQDYWNLFRGNMQTWTPFFPHLKEAWEKRHHPNLLFLFYEDMLEDLPSVIRRVAEFLGKPFNDDQLNSLCEHLQFDKFSKNKAVQLTNLSEAGLLKPGEKFIRKGKAGGWREYFDAEMTQQAQRWIADNLRATDLRFPDVTTLREDWVDS